MRHKRALSALIIATSLIVAACGSDDDASPAAGSKTIEVSMTDNEFTPNSFEVEVGQEVTFEFTNDGTVDHEAILGSEAEQDDHEAEMMDDGSGGGDMDGMDHGGGSDTDAITVKPGDTGTLTKTFDAAGTVILGCHVPGHYDAGMKATVTVA
ncbi:cupredoxin domain-containing protein [Aquihabitans daechungensis]|uniref:cupredoxin domain-containing protein n=1 Tax=Aquihabitans daechungensis TaxID=1052257 RepID=UPI003B9EEE0E